MSRYLGRVLFWLVWPALYLYFRSSERSRVAIICDENILLVKGWWSTWFGDDRWTLPGGGIHRSETPSIGAARELAEELGLSILPKDLIALGAAKVSDFGISYQAQFFTLRLAERPELQRSREVTHYSWVRLKDIERMPLKPEIRQALAALPAAS